MPEARQIPIVTDNSIYLATEIYAEGYRANKIGQHWNLFGKKSSKYTIPASFASFFCCHGNVAFFSKTAIKNPPVSCWWGSTLILHTKKRHHFKFWPIIENVKTIKNLASLATLYLDWIINTPL